MTTTENFRAAMRRAGLEYSGPLQADGKLHRIGVEGDKARNSWYVLHDIPGVGVFGCWRRGFKESWSERKPKDYTAAEFREVQTRWKQADEQERIRHERARKIAAWIVNRATPARADHPYLKRKTAKPYGQLLEYHGALLLPLRDSNGGLCSLQFIDANSRKRFLTGGQIAGCSFVLAEGAGGPLVICEGYTTGASIHEATGCAVICAMNCGNLLAVAKALRARFPQREIIVAGDDDAWTDGNPGRTKATAAAKAIHSRLTLPRFKGINTKPTDFNDLYQLEGYSSVKNQIEAAIEPESDTPQGTTDLKAEWLVHFDKAICPSSKLARLDVPERERIIGEWFNQGDLGFIFAPRGLGKTWLAMHIARQCAEGGIVGPWKVHQSRCVLYVDGEMALDAIRERDAALSGTPADGMFYLQHEGLFHLTGKVLNLTNPTVQTALLEQCQRAKIEVLILDNLSCLFAGIAENKADDWELVLPWLLEFRRRRIAVVIIAHAGRNGFMRGTSRREDAAFWMIQLTEAKDACEIQNGAKFVARFVKNRNTTEVDCPPLEWHFQLPKGEPRAVVTWKTLSTAQIFRQWIEDGVTSATEIAEEMGISKGQVSKLAKRGIMDGWLKKEGRDYALTGKS